MPNGIYKRPPIRLLVVSLFVFIGSSLNCLFAIEESDLFEEPPRLDKLYELYNSGNYEIAISYAESGQEFDPWVTDWEYYKAKSLLAIGEYEAAYESLETYLAERSYDLRPRLLYREAALYTGRTDEAERQKEALGYLINERSRRYAYDPENIVAVGQVALLYEVEPKIVLENFFRRAQEFGTPPQSSYLSAGNLALSKNDYKLASETFQKGLENYPSDTELWHGLAASFREGDREKLFEYAQNALRFNPHHVPTRILIAEQMIAAESYEQAGDQLDLALATNPLSPQALALKASIAYIKSDKQRGDELRELAISTWHQNPGVDFQIGRQLSRKYRFEDGAAFQTAALQLNPSYNPARIQLAQDLLRLGRNKEAWRYADAVHENDPYDIAAYNLVTLRDRIQSFTTLESEHFVVRLSSDEAPVYGGRALRVLERAHERLTERYGIQLPQKTTVEIYKDPADFETRTFGMPGNPGYLGVCFGPVFTVNSPSTRSANWEAVLYHEFCHTITLALSNNRMPRWLSEGISVYEEQVENSAWGQRMSASYRDRILSGNLHLLSNMSASFLEAQSGEDVQFAYYQSYLAVEYIVTQYGISPIKDMLESLAQGIEVNDAFTSHLAPLAQLDSEFSKYAKSKAAQLASDYRFDTTELPNSSIFDYLQPNSNYTTELSKGKDALAREDWTDAIEILEQLVSETGYLPGDENAHWFLAKAYRGVGDTNNEARVLREMTQHEANRIQPVTRLLEIYNEKEAVDSVHRWADAWIAINPMAETPWRALLSTAPELGYISDGVEAANALLALETPDAPSLHFQLATLLAETDPQQAKLHVLYALEEAPRFQKAYELLVKLNQIVPRSLDTKPRVPLDALDLNNDFLN